jgi:sigma-B regulation protein RsbU (phosphoserine phosphatase)
MHTASIARDEEDAPMSSRRILLVEDSSTTRRMLAMMLEEEGYDVRTAVDGSDGLVKAREDPRPELILTDYEMPELDGPGLYRAVKADEELRTIPVVVLTSHGDVGALESAADEVIRKPKSPGDTQEMFARIRARFQGAALDA